MQICFRLRGSDPLHIRKPKPKSLSVAIEHPDSGVVSTLREWANLANFHQLKAELCSHAFKSLTLCKESCEKISTLFSEFSENYSVIVCRNEEGRIEAVGIYDQLKKEVINVVDHPSNIKGIPGVAKHLVVQNAVQKILHFCSSLP